MADRVAITSLGSLATPASGDELIITDVSDTTDGASGTTKKITRTNLLGTVLGGLESVTASAAELNILDGATLDVNELNILDGVTSTTAELNILDGVTATTEELNKLDGVTSTAADINKLAAVSGSLLHAGSNLYIVTGWGDITGDGSSNKLSEAVTFGVTFTGIPIVLLSSAGAATVASAPDSLDDYASSGSASSTRGGGVAAITTTGFTAVVYDGGGVLATTVRYAYTWIAIGIKA